MMVRSIDSGSRARRYDPFDSGWGLVVLPHGRVIWDNVEDHDGGPRHLKGLTQRATLKLMEPVADGDLESDEAHSWARGYDGGSAI